MILYIFEMKAFKENLKVNNINVGTCVLIFNLTT